MSDLKRVTSLLAGDMAAFKPKFRAAVTTDVALLDTVMRYILRRKGKQMRPMFVFLSARLHGGVDAQGGATDRAHTAAALIELLHTATLVHDDVVDESPLRRGVFSIQALWKKKVAVLVGDYLLSRGLLAAVDAEAFDLLKITSRAVREMSEGELLQIEKARRLDITEEVYFDIIRRKTASLLAACCACGAAAAGADNKTVERMWGLGEACGVGLPNPRRPARPRRRRPHWKAHRTGHPRAQDDAAAHPHARQGVALRAPSTHQAGETQE